MRKIIHLHKRKHRVKKESLELSHHHHEGGSVRSQKQPSYDKVSSSNTDKLKKMLKDLQIEAKGGSVSKKKTFSL